MTQQPSTAKCACLIVLGAALCACAGGSPETSAPDQSGQGPQPLDASAGDSPDPAQATPAEPPTGDASATEHHVAQLSEDPGPQARLTESTNGVAMAKIIGSIGGPDPQAAVRNVLSPPQDSPCSGRGKMKRGAVRALGGRGVIDGGALKSALGRALPGIKRCYEGSMCKTATPEGIVTISIHVDNDGRVSSASVTKNEIAPELGACIASKLKALVLPPPEGGTVIYSCPYYFAPAL